MFAFEALTYADGETAREWLTYEAVKRWICIDDWDAFFAWASPNPDYYMFRAIIGNKLLGIIGLEIVGAQGFILMMIDPAQQNRGYGKLLLKQFLRDARQLTRDELTVIEAGIFPGNTGSVRCFTACGFLHTGPGKDGEQRYEYIV